MFDEIVSETRFLAPAFGLWWFYFPGKHFISFPVWFIEASVIPSAPTVPDKSRAMLDWKDRGAIFQMDLFFENILWHNHVFSLKAQGRAVCQIAVVSWLPGLNRNRSLCVNRTQRHSETSPILLYTLSQEIKVRETLQEAG